MAYQTLSYLGQCFAYSSLALMRHHNKANYKVRHLTGSLLIVSVDYSYHHGSEHSERQIGRVCKYS